MMREKLFLHIRALSKQRTLIVGVGFFILGVCIFGAQHHFIGEKVGQLIEPHRALAHYQFTPTHGTIVTGASTTITSALGNTTEGVNVGSWKGTLADDNYHWVVAGAGASGLDVNLTLGGVQLNGANKLIVQTEFDLDPTVLATEVQICDWTSSTDVDDAADSECTGGGWRTLNTKNELQGPQRLVHSTGIPFQWHLYNGYWSTGTTGGSSINTPLTNFLNGADQMKFRYFSASSSVSEIAIDYLRVYAVVDPVYHAGGFVQESGGTPSGHYGNTFSIGHSVTAQLGVTTGDAIYLGVPGTVATTSNFYLAFKNVKTYTGMNTILVNAETLCSLATAGLQYRFKIHNFNTSTWEDISQPLDCSLTGFFNNFALNNIVIDNYINASNEIWVGVYALSNSTTQIRIDSIYLMLGTTNTDANSCEISFGSNIAGRIATNPSAPGADRIQALTSDGTYMYAAGYDSAGIDNEWRIEKRNLSDGELVSAFGVGGATSTDPSASADQIFAIATTSGAIFVAGYDTAAGTGQWRIEKRDSTDGSFETAFGTNGTIITNPSANLDHINAIATDASYLYVAGVENTTSGTWRIHKYDITTGALVTAFDGDGIATSTLAASGDERPQALQVDDNYLYIAGYDNVPGNIEWRLEKRNKTTGALCAGGGECAAGAFDTDGVVQTNPSSGVDAIRALALTDTHVFLAGYDSSTTNNQWRIEKRDIATGALETAFDTDGIMQYNPSTGADWVTALALDDTRLYAIGNVSNGAWRVDARDITTGASTTFSGNGSALSEDGGDDQPLAVVREGGYLYVAGYGTAPGDNQWLIEKRATSTGLRSTDSFGANDCTGTRNIDITGGNRDAWTVLTQDESTNHSTPYYALDTDGDAAIEEAGSATIGFSVAVPGNSAVTGIYWAGRAMNGAGAGTVRLAVKDYSGFTGITGGRSLVGASLGAAMTYTDPLTVGGITSGGTAGYITNPEDHIDTLNNEMALSLVTNSDGASTTNAVNVWDFAMVSISWVEPEPVPVYSISITSDGTIQYGFVDLSAASSTVGGDTQVAENTGSLNEKLNIRSSNALGGTSWLLAATIGSNQYTHEFSTTTGATWKTMPDSSTYVVADPSVTPSGTVDFDFRLTMPSGTTDFVEKSITITVQAVAP